MTSVGVNRCIIHKHPPRKGSVVIRASGPLIADGKIDMNKVGFGVEGPDHSIQTAQTCWRVCDIWLRRVIYVIRCTLLFPEDAVPMPAGRGLARRKIESRAMFEPANPLPWIDPLFQSRMVAPLTRSSTFITHTSISRRPAVGGGDVIAQVAGRKPRALCLGHLGAEFKCARIAS